MPLLVGNGKIKPLNCLLFDIKIYKNIWRWHLHYAICIYTLGYIT